jgi:starch-binding outer membrane protein, SusD/RagB family
MNNKSIIYCFLFGGYLVTTFSCSKYLDKEPQGTYTTTDFYTSSNAALESVNSAYQQLTFTNATNNPLWVFGDVASDDADKGGNLGDQPDINTIDNFTYNSSNGMILNEWSNFYEGITNCNLVLANVPAINMDTTLRARILGEARFLRSWYYFMLLNIYGNIPVILRPLAPSQLQIAQSPTKTIYESVIEPDLMAAMKVLPVSYSGVDIGRATSGAAAALLSKVYLYQEKWDSSLIYSNQIINSGIYSLMPIYSQDFDADHKNNQESIFEVQMLSNQPIAVGDALNQWFAPQSDNGYYFNAPTGSFVNEFFLDSTAAGIQDPRLDYTVGRPGIPWFNGETFLASWSPATGYLTRKYQQPFTEVSSSLKGTGSCDYVAIRYADVLLFNAEALNELGQSAQALIPLNLILKRARESYLYDSSLAGFGSVPTGLLPNIQSTNQDVVRGAIQHERRKEFGFEFHRFFDLMRYAANQTSGSQYLGAANITQKLKADSAASAFNYAADKTFPIPYIETQLDQALH